MVTKHNLFRPSKAESKADTTTTAAKSILAEEASAREAKTKRLREARMQRDSSEPQAETPKTARKPAAGKRSKP